MAGHRRLDQPDDVRGLDRLPHRCGAADLHQEYARDTRANRWLINATSATWPASLDRLRTPRARDLRPGAGAITGRVHGRSIIAGGLTLAVLVLPFVIITRRRPCGPCRTASATPGTASERPAGRWSGATCCRTPRPGPDRRVLSLARAFGETAPLLLVGASTGFLATGNASFLRALRAVHGAAHHHLLVVVAARRNLGAHTRPPSWCCWSCMLLVNIAAIILRNRYERKW